MSKTIAIILIFSSLSSTFCISDRGGSKDTYYVNIESGNDSNPGTIKKPIKTITELNVRLLKNSYCVYFAAGQIFDGTLRLEGICGNEESPFVVTSYGEGRALINGGNYEGIKANECKNLKISNLNVRGSGRKDGNTTNGVALIRTINSIVENVIAEGFQKSGLDLFNCSGVVVKNVITLNNGFCGINVMGSERKLSTDILIYNCRAENNPGDPTNLNNHSGNGILIGVSDNVTVDHCIATNNGWDMPREGNGPVGIWSWESNNVSIQYCISYRNKTSKNGKDGGGFDLDGGVTNSIIQYCLSYENEGAGYGLFQYLGASDWSQNVVRNCITINDGLKTAGSGSFFLWNGSGEETQLADCQICNNMAYCDSVPVISFENASAHKNFTFYNNIFIGTGQLVSGKNSGSLFKGNLWWVMRKPARDPDLEFMKFNNIIKTLTDI
jgi:hypothetical protein